MTDIKLSDIGAYILIVASLVFFLACFISGVVLISENWDFKWDLWAWHTWFLFVSSCILILSVGTYFIPFIQLDLKNRMSLLKGHKSTKSMLRELYDKLISDDIKNE